MAPFKPYGTPPAFDLDEYKDNFELWKEQWDVYIALSTIDTELPQNDRPAYKANLLKHSLSKSTFQALLRSGLTAAQLLDPNVIIDTLKQRCNSGRNVHVWRQRFQLRVQRPNESLDDWLCDLRDLATKADFATGCCVDSEKARLLQQLIFGAQDDEDRRRLLEKGRTLTLDQAIEFMHASENARKDSSGLRGAEALSVQQTAKSNYKTQKADSRNGSKSGQTSKKPTGGGHQNDSKCIWCGAEKKHTRKECPAHEKECNKCHKLGNLGSVCLGKNGQTTPVREASTNHSRRNDQIQSAGSSHCFGNGQHHRQGTRRSSRHHSIPAGYGSRVGRDPTGPLPPLLRIRPPSSRRQPGHCGRIRHPE